MKRATIALSMILSAALLLAGCGAPQAQQSAPDIPKAEQAEQPGTVTVSGEGTVSVQPDKATVSLGVMTQNADAKVAQQENAQLMTAIVEAVKEQGIDEKDIATSQMSIYPTYNYDSKTPTITGYEVRNGLSINVRELDKAGGVIDAAIAAGANQIDGISFGLTDPTAAYNEALKKALDGAAVKAAAIADGAKIKIAGPVNITESGVSYVPVSRNAGMVMEAAAADDAGIGGTIQAGSLTVSASVSVTYHIQ